MPSPDAPVQSERVVMLEAAFHELADWGETRGWSGTDPYDGLNATRLSTAFERSVTGKRLLTQLVKRSPINLRPVFGVRPAESSVSFAYAVSAYARQRWLSDTDTNRRIDEALGRLSALRCAGYAQPCWGYHFDVQTRVFFYPKGSPNTIATVFAGQALLDAYERTGNENLLSTTGETADFLLEHVPQTETERGAFFGYLVGDKTPIHNANMLVAALLARVGRATDRSDLLERAEAAVKYSVAYQRDDGSWPYGERPGLEWVDGFHTGYVLESLLKCDRYGIAGCADALARGLTFYRQELFCSDGTPKYYPGSVYPIDAQCAAQGIQTLALAAELDPANVDLAWRVFTYTQQHLRRRDGSYKFQRRRLWSNGTPHMRWVAAPLLLAFSHLGTVTA